MQRKVFALGAVVVLISIALGAFGAHALEAKLDARALNSWHTASRYQTYHGLGLIIAALAHDKYQSRAPTIAAVAFVVGLLLFCGSLYALALGSPRAFGAIAPIGGLAFMIGWAALAAAPFSRPPV